MESGCGGAVSSMGGVKTGIQVVRDLDEVAEEVDALEVRQEIVG